MLTKKDKKKRYNKKAKTSSVHVFDAWGDRYDSKFMKSSANTAQKALSGSNLGGSIAGIAGGIGGIVEAGMANAKIADTTEQEQEREARENWQSSASDNNSLLAEMAGDVSIGENTSWKSIRGVTPGQMVGNTLKGMVSGASAGAKVGGPWGAVAGAAAGLASGIAGIFTGNSKAKKKAAELNEAAKQANLAKAQTLTAKAGALDQASDARALAAYAAEGGQINPFPSSEFGSPITEFNAGGSHEENPYDGIPQGVAPDGLPNLVEEGEVKYDNYIFSDRLMLNKEDKKKYKFLKGKTYADAAKAIKKELGIDERPNDPIAKADLEEQLNLLSTLQEKKRASKGLKGENRMMYKNGGHIFSATQNNYDMRTPEQKASVIVKPLELSDLSLGNRPSSNKTSEAFDWSALGQAAPAIGNAIGVITQAFNKPDYKHAKELQQSNEEFTPISYTPLTQRMTYKPMDVNYYGNKLGAQAGATRRAIREQTASNPYAATAALLTADANAQNQLGDLYKKAEEYNLAQREKVNTFNRATDSANAEMSLKAQQLNSALLNGKYDRDLKRGVYAAQLKMAEDEAWSKAMTSSMTSLFDNLGAIGKERLDREDAVATILGQAKNLTPELQEWATKRLGLRKNGGKIHTKTKRNRRFTL